MLFSVESIELLVKRILLLSFSLLHRLQQVTIFFQVLAPPLDFGIMWSIVRFLFEPQYPHWYPSLLKILLLLNNKIHLRA